MPRYCRRVVRTMNCELPSEVLEYLEQVESGASKACREQAALAAHVRRCFATEDIFVDTWQLRKYMGLAKYFPYKELFPWESAASGSARST